MSYNNDNSNSSYGQPQGGYGDRQPAQSFGADRQAQPPCNKLYIGNLLWSVEQPEFQELFPNAVEAVIMKDKETGRSRGFGFVTFATTEEAEATMQAMNNFEFKGRALRVNFATSSKGAGGFGGGSGGYKSNSYAPANTGYSSGGYNSGYQNNSYDQGGQDFQSRNSSYPAAGYQADYSSYQQQPESGYNAAGGDSYGNHYSSSNAYGQSYTGANNSSAGQYGNSGYQGQAPYGAAAQSAPYGQAAGQAGFGGAGQPGYGGAINSAYSAYGQVPGQAPYASGASSTAAASDKPQY